MFSLDRQLFRATETGNTALMLSLISQGADLNASFSGTIPMHVAAILQSTDPIKTLLSAGADVDVKNDLGTTALHLASSVGTTEMVLTLLLSGADIHLRERNGSTVLHRAASACSVETAIVLMEAGASPNSRDARGFTPLLKLNYLKDRHTALALIAYGADSSHDCQSGDMSNLTGLTMREAAVQAGLVRRLQVLFLSQSLEPGDQPEPLLKLALNHSQTSTAAFLQSHMAAKAIDELIASSPRVVTPRIHPSLLIA